MSDGLDSEAGRMMRKIDSIRQALGIKNDKSLDTSKLNEYDRIRLEIISSLNEIETLLSSRDDFSSKSTGVDVLNKNKLQSKIDDKLVLVNQNLNLLRTTIESEKKKKKSVGPKEELYKLLMERYDLCKNRSEGREVSEKKIQENINHMEKLENIINNRSSQQDRELSSEERDKIDSWKREVEEQDKELESVLDIMKDVKKEVKNISRSIDNVGMKIKLVDKHAEKTDNKLKTTNAQLKDLLEKVRSSDKICVDILLICVCLGLCSILYNMLKSKSNTTTNNSVSRVS